MSWARRVASHEDIPTVLEYAGSVEAVHNGVTPAPRDQPSINRGGSHQESPPQRSRGHSDDHQAVDDADDGSTLLPAAGSTSKPNIIPLS
jgi:hypothetical protein